MPIPNTENWGDMYGGTNSALIENPQQNSEDDLMKRWLLMQKFFGSGQTPQMPQMPQMGSGGTGVGQGLSSGIASGINMASLLKGLYKPG